jgi:glutathione peroxidase-family protein
LVNKLGHVVKRYGSDAKQGEFEQDVYNELTKQMDLPSARV